MTDLAALARAGDLSAIRAQLMRYDVPAVVDELERQDGVTRAVAFRSLPKDVALGVFEQFDPSLQGELIRALRAGEVAELMAQLDPDDRAGFVEELPASVARRLLTALAPSELVKTAELLGYPAGSVGRRMTPEVIAIPVHMNVGQALARVRCLEPSAETIYLLAVVGDGRMLEGVVSLRRLFVSDPDVAVASLMTPPISVHAIDEQEVAARVLRDHGVVAMPVVDAEGRLLGVFTVDDAMRVLEDAESEDQARAGGAEPLRRPYLATPVLGLVRRRITWLLVLIVAATLTVNVLDYFEDTLAAVVSLALFVPFLIGTGGNAGSQAATTVVRAMAVGDVRLADVGRVVGREILTGALLGTCLAAVGFGAAMLLVEVRVALVLALALVAVCVLATTVGSLTPMVARRVGVDPAVVSAPFITTFVDASGLVIYFLLARLLLGV